MIKRNLKIFLILVIAFIVYFLLRMLYFSDVSQILDVYINTTRVSNVLTNIIIGLPLLIGIFCIHKLNKKS